MGAKGSSSRGRLVAVAALLVLAALVFTHRDRIQFDWPAFFAQLRGVSGWHVLAAVALILGANWVRSVRWMVFLLKVKRVPPFALVGAQLIGFTAVALFGRLADLTRPYLVSRRVGLPMASQVAVYTIERMFDLGSAAVLFSCALALTPRTAPHHEAFVRAGIASLAGTIFLAAVALVVRTFGVQLAARLGAMSGRVVRPAGKLAAEKILGFRGGLDAISSAREFVAALALSLVIWGMIGGAYVETAHAFVHTPELATLSFSRTMLLMAASLGGSLVQLPVIGWFTQVAVTAAAMHTFYGAPIEAATACGAVLFLVTMLAVVPFGLVWARLEHVSLRNVAGQSGADEEAP